MTDQTTDTAGEIRQALVDYGRSWTRVMHALGLPQEADTDDAVAEIERLRAEVEKAKRAYGIAVNEINSYSAKLTQARSALLVADMLINRLYEPLTTGETGHPGEPSRRTRWIPQRRVDELWRAIMAWRDSWAPGAPPSELPTSPNLGDDPCGGVHVGLKGSDVCLRCGDTGKPCGAMEGATGIECDQPESHPGHHEGTWHPSEDDPEDWLFARWPRNDWETEHGDTAARPAPAEEAGEADRG